MDIVDGLFQDAVHLEVVVQAVGVVEAVEAVQEVAQILSLSRTDTREYSLQKARNTC
jgi:hypothetical protein